MSDSIIRMTIDALWLVLLLSAPPIVAASAVGLLVALVQAATQLQEQTLQYTLKFFAIVATIFLTAYTLLTCIPLGAILVLLTGSLYQYGNTIFTQFPAMVRQ